MAIDNLPIAHATTRNIGSMHTFAFKKSVMDKLYQTYGQGFNTLDILRSIGRSGKLVPNEVKTAEEIGYDVRTVTVASVTSSSNTEVVIVLHADDLDSLNNYYPRVGFTITFGNTIRGFTQTRITAISAVTTTVSLTCTRYDSNAPNLSDLVTWELIQTGTEVGIFDGAFAVETGQPAPTSMATFERSFAAQILKETITFGGMELAKQKWLPNREGTSLFNAELSRAEFALDRQIEAALIMGQSNTATLTQASAVDSANLTIGKIKGIWTWIDELGYELNYAGATGPSFDNLDTMSEYFESQGVTNTVIMVLAGGGWIRRMENSGITYVKGTSSGLHTPNFFKQDGGMYMSGKPDTYINVGFEGIKKGGNLFLFHTLNMFTNPFQYGISGYLLNDAAIAIPISMVKDKKSGITIPNLSIEYVGLDGYSRERVAGGIAGMDGYMQQKLNLPLISSVDANNFYWLTHPMVTFMEANKGIIMQRSS